MPFPKRVEIGEAVTAENYNLIIGNLESTIVRVGALEERGAPLGKLPGRIALLEQEVRELKETVAKLQAALSAPLQG